MLHPPLQAHHPDTTSHYQQQQSPTMSLAPTRGRTLTHRRGSASARDPFNILPDRDPTHTNPSPNEDRQMTSRLSIVRVIPPHHHNSHLDPAASVHLSNRPPDPGLIQNRSLIRDRSRRVSFASASFAQPPGEAPVSLPSGLSRSRSSSSARSFHDHDDVASEASPQAYSSPIATDGARRRSASISTQNPYRIAQRYGSGFVYGGGYGYGGVFGYGREAPLTPQQVYELAKASLKPDPKTLGVRGNSNSSSASESGEDELGMEIQPANFLPMGEGEFLPFVDRPKEVTHFLASQPTDRLIALLEQAFPNHLRLPRDHPEREFSQTSAAFAASEMGETLPRPSPTLVKALMSDPPLKEIEVVAPSPRRASESGSTLTGGYGGLGEEERTQEEKEAQEEEQRQRAWRRFDHPQTWSFPTLLAWMCTVPRSQADDREWVRRIRRCVMERTEKICVVLMGALGVPLEEGDEVMVRRDVVAEEALADDEMEEEVEEIEEGKPAEVKRSKSDETEVRPLKGGRASALRSSSGGATPKSALRTGGATPNISSGNVTPKISSGHATPKVRSGAATPRTALPGGDDTRTISSVLHSAAYVEPRAKKSAAKAHFGDLPTATPTTIELVEHEHDNPRPHHHHYHNREEKKMKKMKEGKLDSSAGLYRSPRHLAGYEDDLDTLTNYFQLDIEPIEYEPFVHPYSQGQQGLEGFNSKPGVHTPYPHPHEMSTTLERDEQGVFIHSTHHHEATMPSDYLSLGGAGGIGGFRPRSDSGSSFTSSGSGSGSVSGSGVDPGSRLSGSGSVAGSTSHMEAIGESEDESEDSEDLEPSAQAPPAPEHHEQTETTMGARPNKHDLEMLKNSWAARSSSPKLSSSAPVQHAQALSEKTNLSATATHDTGYSSDHTHDRRGHGPYFGLTFATNKLPSHLAPTALVSVQPADSPMPGAVASKTPPPASLLSPSALIGNHAGTSIHSTDAKEAGGIRTGGAIAKHRAARRNTVNVAHMLTGAPGYEGYSWRLGGPLFPKSFDSVAEVDDMSRGERGRKKEEVKVERRADPGDGLVKNIRARSEIAPTVPVRISSPRPRVARAMGGKSALSKLTTDVPVFTPPNSPAVQRW